MVFWGLRFHTDQELSQRVAANLYHDDEILELKIPVTLPYPLQDQGFQPVDGRFEHRGQHYKLIKHKFENDTLYVVCIRDIGTRQLVNTMQNYVEMANGFEGTSPNQKALNYISKLIKDFCAHDKIDVVRQFRILARNPFFERMEALINPVLPVHAPPPRA